jgi:predicted phosphodiesterase
MRYALFSDVHANLAALREVLAAARARAVDAFICLGDFVGYNAEPNECVDVLRELPHLYAIAGNHDRYALATEAPDDFGAAARDAILWTRAALRGDVHAWLSELPPSLELEEGAISIVHAGWHPRVHDTLHVSSTARVAHSLRALARRGARIGFFGHTHVAAAFDTSVVGVVNRASSPGVTRLRDRDAHVSMVNPGSVGQPRDGDARASFAIFDSRSWGLEFVRVPYDEDATRRKTRAAGLPERWSHGARRERSLRVGAAFRRIWP